MAFIAFNFDGKLLIFTFGFLRKTKNLACFLLYKQMAALRLHTYMYVSAMAEIAPSP